MRACSARGSPTAAAAPIAKPSTRTTASPCRPSDPTYHIRRLWLTPTRKSRLLRRLRQRRPVAAVPHRARAPAVSRRGLGAVPRRQRQVRRRRGRRKRRARTRSCWCRTITSRSCRAMIRERLPKATIITFWHIPWPNPEAFAHLPVARRAARRAARRRHPGLPHAVPRQQLPRDASTASSRRASTARRSTVVCRGSSTAGASLSDLDRVAAGAARTRCRRSTRRASASACASTCRAGTGSARRRASRLHQGHHRALQRGRAPARARAAMDRPLHVHPDRRAVARDASPTTATTRSACTRASAEINARYRRGAPADHPARRASRARRGLRVPGARRRLHREQPARRDESRGEGVRRRARRRARRAHPVAVRRRIARTARGAHRQSLRRRPVRERAACWRWRCRGRAARPHAPHAQHHPRVQRLPLGGPHAARRRRDAAAQALRRAGRGADVLRSARWHYELPTPRPARFGRPPPPPLASDCALFLDIDGTLVELAHTPDAVRVDEELAAALPRLVARRSAARSRADHRPRDPSADQLVSRVWSCRWRASTDGSAATPRVDAPACAASKDDLANACASCFREAREAPSAAPARGQGRDDSRCTTAPRRSSRRTSIARCADRCARTTGTRLQPGKRLLEVRRDGRDKGTAIHDFMAERRSRAGCRCSSATTSPTSTASRRSSVGAGGWTSRSARAHRSAVTVSPTSPPCERG